MATEDDALGQGPICQHGGGMVVKLKHQKFKRRIWSWKHRLFWIGVILIICLLTSCQTFEQFGICRVNLWTDFRSNCVGALVYPSWCCHKVVSTFETWTTEQLNFKHAWNHIDLHQIFVRLEEKFSKDSNFVENLDERILSWSGCPGEGRAGWLWMEIQQTFGLQNRLLIWKSRRPKCTKNSGN